MALFCFRNAQTNMTVFDQINKLKNNNNTSESVKSYNEPKSEQCCKTLINKAPSFKS